MQISSWNEHEQWEREALTHKEVCHFAYYVGLNILIIEMSLHVTSKREQRTFYLR